jgi:hypothetical protein
VKLGAMTKRKFKIVKRVNNIAVLGICEHCNAVFATEPNVFTESKDAHAHLQKQFVAHQCKRLDSGELAAPVRSRGFRR